MKARCSKDKYAFLLYNEPVTAAALVICASLALQGAPPSAGTSDFSSARRAAAALPQLHSLLVSHRGVLALEYYAPGRSATRHANIKSAAKSVVSTLVGIAIERKLIAGVDERIVRWFPHLRRDPDKRKQAITIEDLLTMRSGLQSTSGENYGRWVNSRNWVRYALDRPMVSDPGTSMEYSTGTSHILSAILTKASGKSTHQFATEALAEPLGISLARWPRDPQGIYFGGNEMLMTPRQMIAFGEMHRNQGRVGNRQVVPAAWVDTSCVPRTRSVWDPTREYGYGWWIQELGGHRACFAWGFGGQYIMVFRELELVVAITSSTAASDERRGYRRRLFDLLETHVLPRAAAVTDPPRRTREIRDTGHLSAPDVRGIAPLGGDDVGLAIHRSIKVRVFMGWMRCRPCSRISAWVADQAGAASSAGSKERPQRNPRSSTSQAGTMLGS
jgi:CubicO group peptidase (beta-lactamase class C family)